MNLLRMLKTDLFKGFFSVGFLVAVIAVALFKYLGSLSFASSADSVFLLYFNSDTSSFGSIRYVLTALPFASVFISDLKNNYVIPQAMRSSVKKYAVSKVISAAICGMTALFLGELLFVIVSSFFLPLATTDENMLAITMDAMAYGSIAKNGNYILYFIVTVFSRSLVAIPLAITAMLISTKIENHFVVVFSPLIVYYILLQVTAVLPPWLTFRGIFNGVSNLFGNAAVNILYTVGFSLVSGIILGLICIKFMVRRIHND